MKMLSMQTFKHCDNLLVICTNALSGFDRYKGGLDTVHDLTGLHSVCTHWRGIEIMFHVSTLLPHEENDPQKVRYKTAIDFCLCMIQFRKMNMVHIVNKPYANEVTLSEPKLS